MTPKIFNHVEPIPHAERVILSRVEGPRACWKRDRLGKEFSRGRAENALMGRCKIYGCMRSFDCMGFRGAKAHFAQDDRQEKI